MVLPNVRAVHLEELLGALVIQVETLKRKLTRSWEDEGPDSHKD